MQALGLPQDSASVLQQGPACLGRGNALAAPRQQRNAKRILHVADTGRRSGERQMCAFGAMGDAAGFDHMPEQAQIGEVKTHNQYPSYFAKEDFA
jgi:hypothetical protein